MPLSLYLDDCANSDLLANLLRLAGPTVVRPADAGITGEDDDVHLDYAIRHGLILVTKNPADCLELLDNVTIHHGVFGIYQDNDVTRDMTDAEIVAAIGKLESTAQLGYQIAQNFHSLNDWR